MKIGCVVGVDAFHPGLEEARKTGLYKELHCVDIKRIGEKFSPRSFDAVLLSDVIEHLEREEAEKVMRDAVLITAKKVIVYTPNGFFEQEAFDGNEHQHHVSGWSVRDMKKLGFDRITGVHGWKPLGKKYPMPLAKPYFFWRGLSTLTQPLVKLWPEQAFQILCIKEIGKA